MAGRESKLISGNTCIHPDMFYEELSRVFHNDKGAVEPRFGGHDKMVVSNVVDGHRVFVEGILEEEHIELTMRITEGIADFVGPDNYERLQELMEEPLDGPAQSVYLAGTRLVVFGCLIGDGTPPFVRIKIYFQHQLRQFFRLLFGVDIAYEFISEPLRI